ncbi:hypothetical protein ZYGR_0DG00100, partial [Zygosaccharomyces rouxii]
FFQHRSWATPDFFFSGQQCQTNFREHVLKPYLQGTIHPGETESDIIHTAVGSYLAGVHGVFEEFLRASPTIPSLKFQSLPRDRYGGHLLFLRRFYNSTSIITTLYRRFFVDKVITRIIPQSAILPYEIIYDTYTLVLSVYNTKYYKLDVIDRLKFLSFLIATAPGVDMEKWDQVAMKMNQYLHTRNSKTGRRRESFFDGKQCLDFFMKEFKPLVSDKNTVSCSKKLLQPLFAGQMLPYHDLDCIVVDALRVCQFTSEERTKSFLSFGNISVFGLVCTSLLLKHLFIMYCIAQFY